MSTWLGCVVWGERRCRQASRRVQDGAAGAEETKSAAAIADLMVADGAGETIGGMPCDAQLIRGDEVRRGQGPAGGMQLLDGPGQRGRLAGALTVAPRCTLPVTPRLVHTVT